MKRRPVSLWLEQCVALNCLRSLQFQDFMCKTSSVVYLLNSSYFLHPTSLSEVCRWGSRCYVFPCSKTGSPRIGERIYLCFSLCVLNILAHTRTRILSMGSLKFISELCQSLNYIIARSLCTESNC